MHPDSLVRPRYRTLFKAFYTERGLYLGWDMEQPADTLVRRYSSRDMGWLRRDTVSFTLDTSGEGEYGYWGELALGGTVTDGTVLRERQFNDDWDGAWLGATAVTAQGWSAEVFFPWSQMAMPRAADGRRIGIFAARQVCERRRALGLSSRAADSASISERAATRRTQLASTRASSGACSPTFRQRSMK